MLNIYLFLFITSLVPGGGMATSGCFYEFGYYTQAQKTKLDQWFADCMVREGSWAGTAEITYTQHF